MSVCRLSSTLSSWGPVAQAMGEHDLAFDGREATELVPRVPVEPVPSLPVRPGLGDLQRDQPLLVVTNPRLPVQSSLRSFGLDPSFEVPSTSVAHGGRSSGGQATRVGCGSPTFLTRMTQYLWCTSHGTTWTSPR